MRMSNYLFGLIVESVALKKLLSLVKMPPPAGSRPVQLHHLAPQHAATDYSSGTEATATSIFKILPVEYL